MQGAAWVSMHMTPVDSISAVQQSNAVRVELFPGLHPSPPHTPHSNVQQMSSEVDWTPRISPVHVWAAVKRKQRQCSRLVCVCVCCQSPSLKAPGLQPCVGMLHNIYQGEVLKQGDKWVFCGLPSALPARNSKTRRYIRVYVQQNAKGLHKQGARGQPHPAAGCCIVLEYTRVAFGSSFSLHMADGRW